MTHSNSWRMRLFGIGQPRVGWVKEVKLRIRRYRDGPRSLLLVVRSVCVFCCVACFSSGIQRGEIFFDSFRMCNKSREAKKKCLRQIAKMRRTHGAESDWYAPSGEAARPLGALPVPPPLPDLSDPGLHLDFFGQTLDFAVFPHKSRHPLAIGAGINSRNRA